MSAAAKPRRSCPPWVFWLLAVLLLPLIIFALGVGAGFNSAHVEDGGSPSLVPFAPAGALVVLLALVIGFGLRAMRKQADERRWSGPRTLLAVIGAAFVLVLAVSIFNAFVDSLWISVAARSAGMFAALVLTLLYWHRIDEAAREAQKTACLWGVTVAVALCAALEPLTRAAGGVPNLPVLVGDGSSHDWFVSGAVYLLMTQCALALLVWGAWWIRAR